MIDEATGEVAIDFEERGRRSRLRVQFELAPSAHNVVTATLGDIYMHWTKVIRLSFKQYVQMSPLERFEVADVVAMIKIRIFPVVGISPTVYFAIDDGDVRNRLLSPVAYAEYEPL